MSTKISRFLSVITLVFLLSACSMLRSTDAQPIPEPTMPGVGEVGSVAPAPADGSLDVMLAVVVGLGAAGVVLVGVAVLFLLRKHRRAGGAATSTPHLRQSAGSPLEVLPEKTLLKNGVYVVLQAQTVAASGNVYAARGAAPFCLCPHCQSQIEGEETRFCTHCGADLRDMTVVYSEFVIRETTDAQTFAGSARLVALRLHHPGLLLPVDVFTETAYSPVRYYRVEPVYTPAVDLPVPQTASRVLAWGAVLARGLAYLHQHYVVLRRVDFDHVVIDNSHARFVCVDNAHLLPQDAYVKAEAYYAQSVQALGRMLLVMMTGSADSTVDAQVPEDVVALLLRAQQPGMKADALATALEQSLRKLRAPDKVRFQTGQLTDVGQVRSLNEDSVLSLDLSERFRSLGTPVGVFAVADGMGGHAAGDVASQLTIEAVAEQAEAMSALADGGMAWLKQAVAMANHAVYSERTAANNDMGCTLVLALVIGGDAVIANIGDSRAYRLSPDGIAQITTDHSLVERLVEVGQITQQEARNHPQKNIIYRVVGDKPTPEFDVFDHVLMPGEALLLCSDGLSGMLTDEQIWQLWHTTTSPQAACMRLVDAANQAGGVDNISVVIIQVQAA